ncbi:MAG: type II toxin-antitoxin system Phd/YefM family antitoxin [Deltaproteobacteria bacterium]|nr:type II toxin-antitoxin system Phd/YefM family antitoxin [Deltaproteobacteria bacterium]
MHIVGVRELKNRLTHFLSLSRQGIPVIVTDRNRPIAVIHRLDQVEKTAGTEERLASLAHRNRLHLPEDRTPFRPIRRARGGRKASELILEERR